MTAAQELIDRYFAIWNQTDPARRRALIGETYTGDATYLDPMLEGSGPEGIDAMVAAVQQRFPGHRFRQTGGVDAHHDRLRFAWELGTEGAPPVARGTDIAEVADGRLRAVTGFFDHVAS